MRKSSRHSCILEDKNLLVFTLICCFARFNALHMSHRLMRLPETRFHMNIKFGVKLETAGPCVFDSYFHSPLAKAA